MVEGRAAFFQLAGRNFAIPGQFIRQVVAVSRLTTVPRSSSSLLGLFAERGNILPLFDLKMLLTLPTEKQVNTLALVIEHEGDDLAFVIDEMLGFFQYESKQEIYPRDQLQGLAEKEISYQNHTAILLSMTRLSLKLKEAMAA